MISIAEKRQFISFPTLMCAALLFFAASTPHANPDPNFHIYLAYGQSNMEGNATNFDREVDGKEHPRVKMFATTSCPSLGRPTVGEMYPAVPPMFKCDQGLSVADWFGRDMADSMPNVTIGIVPVAQAGTSIRLYDPDDYQNYLASAADWLKNGVNYAYDGNALGRLIEVAKKAQKVGVIKGIIFHQGESDPGMSNWEQIVAKSYEYILSQLGLKAEETPFVAGEMIDKCADKQEYGCEQGMRERVRGLKNYIANFGAAKSDGYGSKGDGLHFTVFGYRGMGERYAQEMLKLIDRGPVVIVPRAPFGGKAAEIPGKIEAENFDVPGTGSDNKTFNDLDSKNNGTSSHRTGDASAADLYDKATGTILGYNQEGEWFEYTVNVKQAGEYKMTASVATDNSTASFNLSLDGSPLTGDIAVSGTDFDVYSTVEANVTLPAGEHILRMTVSSPWFDVDFFNFELIKATGPTLGSDSTGANKNSSVSAALSAIKLMAKQEHSFRLYDLHGKFVTQFNAQNMDAAIHMVQEEVQGLRQGVYLIRATNAAGNNKKIILKK